MAEGLIVGEGEFLTGCFFSTAFKNALAFVVIIVVLLVTPEGLLDEELKERVSER